MASIYGVAQSQTRLKRLSSSSRRAFILLVLLAAHRLLLGKASTRRFLLLQAQGWTLSGSLRPLVELCVDPAGSPASSVLAREGAGCGSVGDVPGAWLASAPLWPSLWSVPRPGSLVPSTLERREGLRAFLEHLMPIILNSFTTRMET